MSTSTEHCPGCGGQDACPGLPVTEPDSLADLPAEDRQKLLAGVPGYHGQGELADFDPGTGRSSWDDWDG